MPYNLILMSKCFYFAQWPIKFNHFGIIATKNVIQNCSLNGKLQNSQFLAISLLFGAMY